MALLRKLFYRNPPDGLLEISERVYGFNCCYSTDVLEEEEYKAYIGATVGQLREHLPDASFMVFNFREGENQSHLANILAEHNMIVMDYPRHYEGCPLLSMEMIHHFLRSSESWLSLGQQNVLLMHCERGGWPVLAFMLASLLIYRKQYSGEQKTLDMVYRQAPKELLQLMTPVNPLPSQLRYLQYVSRRNVSTEWPPSDRALTLDCIIIRFIPNLDGDGGFRPIFRIYGQDPLMANDRIPKVLFSTPKRSKLIRYFKQADCELAKIDIRCHIQGDVVLECINLDEDLEREEMIFRVMFNTAFIRSNILMLGRNEIDSLWKAKDQFPKDFRTEVLFSEMNLATSLMSMDFPSIEEEELPIEAFAKVQEIFSNIDWLGSRTDETLNLLRRLKSSDALQEKLTAISEVGNLSQLTPNKLNLESQLSDTAEETGKDKIKSSVLQISSEQAAPLSSCDSLQGSPVTLDVDPPAPLASFVTAPIQDLAILDLNEFTQPLAVSSPTSETSAPDVLNITKPEPGNLHILSLPSIQAPLAMQPEPPPFTVGPFEPTSPLISSTAHAEESFSTPCQSVHHQPSSDQTLPSLAQPCQNILFGENQSSSVSLSTPSRSLSQNSPSLSALISTPIPPSPPPPPFFSGRLQSTSVFKSLPTSLPLTSSVISETSQPSYVKNSYSAPPAPPPPAPSSVNLLSSAVKNSLSIPSPPPPPAIPTSVANLSSSQLETKKIAFMPARPPPPPHSGSVLAVSVLPSAAPPAPPLLSGFSLKDSSDNTNVLAPPAPPPPAPPGNAMVKAPMQSISGASKAIPAIPGPPSSIFLSAKGRGSCRASPKNQSQNKRANLKPYHWLKLTRAMQGSLWAEAQKASEATKTPEFDMSELESLFSATVPNSDHGNNGGKSKQRGSRAKSDKVQLIELRRAYNCEIMLSKVKIPLPDLMGSVLAMDESALSVDQVENLMKFCPTKEEMELLKGYSGDKENLGKCEIFFLELMKVPRVESKLRVFSFKIQFQLQVCDLRRGLNIVNSASEEIRASLKLRRVMQTILSLGNALNQGTARGSAIGFRLDSLLKLADTRARNSKMTLVHYLCKVLAEKLPELSDFSNDLVNLEASTKIQLKYLAEEMQAISKGLEKVVQELTSAENDGPVSEYFCEALKNFLSHAEAEVRSLTSLYSNVGRNADALALYFGEDPSRCPFEQVVSTLYSFVKTFERAHEENCKQLEFEKKKMQKETEMEKLKTSFSRNVSEHSIQTLIKSGDIHYTSFTSKRPT